jgi:superfamily II DNA or RNA helicase
MRLRPYQEELINKIKTEIKSGKTSICAVLGCGGGKSICQAMISKGATDKGNRVLFLVHRQELCDQIRNTFELCGVNFNLCDVAMVQTVTRHVQDIEKPQLIITDEAHHSLSETYTRIYDYFPDVIKLGFTATPIRMNEGGLGKVFDSLVESVSTKWLIENQYLSPYRYFSVKLADAGNVSVKRGDYSLNELAELMEKNYIYGETVKNYKLIADGKKTIVYCASIRASKDTVKAFNEAGIISAHLDGETPKSIRKETIKKFRSGEITVLSNVDLFGEGLDVPDCECVILLRPTKSLTLYIQQSMRSMRYKEGKTAYIIDHVANVYQHDFPDAQRDWSLKGKKKKKKLNEVRFKECPQCFACLSPLIKVCPSCDHEFVVTEQEEREMIELELKEVDQADLLKKKAYDYYTNITSFDEMRTFQKAKGFKFAWTIHKCLELKIDVPKQYDYMIRRFLS